MAKATAIGTFLALNRHVKNKFVVGTSTLVAGAIAIALILRPSRSISPSPEMGTPEHIPPAARAVIRSRMQHHGAQLGALVSQVVLLDYEAVAHTAGEIYDEPTLARPLTGDELNGVLPERFFALQDDLRSDARRLVAAAARRDSAQLAGELAVLTKGCMACHDLYLHGAPDSSPPENR
jgi:hypothetical protein